MRHKQWTVNRISQLAVWRATTDNSRLKGADSVSLTIDAPSSGQPAEQGDDVSAFLREDRRGKPEWLDRCITLAPRPMQVYIPLVEEMLASGMLTNDRQKFDVTSKLFLSDPLSTQDDFMWVIRMQPSGEFVARLVTAVYDRVADDVSEKRTSEKYEESHGVLSTESLNAAHKLLVSLGDELKLKAFVESLKKAGKWNGCPWVADALKAWEAAK